MYHGFEPEEVDHINLNPQDNRIANLRAANKQLNARNRKVRSDSSNGMKGVRWRDKRKAFEIYICLGGGKKTYVGIAKTLEEAAAKYNEAAEKFFGDFAPKQ